MSPESSKLDVSRVAEQILAYFVEHPDAQDTLEGVVQWWLLQQRIRTAVGEVEAALAELVGKGFVVEHRGGDSRIRYAVNRRRLREIGEQLGASPEVADEAP